MGDSSRAVIFRHRANGAYFGHRALELSGLELLRGWMERTLPDPPVTRLTGLRPTDVGLGLTTMAMPASPWWQSGAGVFLAGSLSFLADGPLGGAVMTAASPGVGMTTSELSIDFLRPATIRSGTLIGRGRLIHSTRSQGLSEVFVEDGRGRMLAHGTSRCILFPIEAASVPPPPDLDPDGVEPHAQGVEGTILDQDYWNARSGMEFLAQLRQGTVNPPVALFTGMALTDYGEATATATMPASPWFGNAYGVTYGGALTFLIDFAFTCACLTTIPAATSFAALDLKVNFLRPVLPDGNELVARATVTHRGRSIAVMTGEILNHAGKQVAVASETILILPGRPWERPIAVQDDVALAAANPP